MKKILCVDDIKTNLLVLEALLLSVDSVEYTIFTALSANDALATLIHEEIDLILLDIMMPEIDGFSCAKMIRSNKKTKDIPIIFVTAKTDDATIEECFKIGGNDYIPKPFNSVELLARVAFHLEYREKEKLLEEERNRYLELSLKYEHAANFDALTQIYNRNMFNSLMSKRLKHQRKGEKPSVFLLFDIDFFKKINDKYGHLMGDHILQKIVSVVKENTRSNDIFVRWGGEEFVLILDVDLEDGVAIAENLRKKIAATDFDIHQKVTCSFGLTQCHKGDTLDDITKRSDDALYRAKSKGRNRVCKTV